MESAPDKTAVREFELFAAYLAAAPGIPPAMAARYVSACGMLLSGETDNLTRFALRHAWSLGFLDAAAGWLAPKSLLRQKLLIAMAVLEAAPGFADRFLPNRNPGNIVYISICIYGVQAALKTLIGIPIYLFARTT